MGIGARNKIMNKDIRDEIGVASIEEKMWEMKLKRYMVI